MTIFITTFAILIILACGFVGGVAWSAYVMATRVQKAQEALWANSEDAEAKRLTPKYQQAIAIAASCWCDGRTVRAQMDVQLGLVIADKIAAYIDALQWCSGLEAFHPEGEAYLGFERICRPLMSFDHKIDTRSTLLG